MYNCMRMPNSLVAEPTAEPLNGIDFTQPSRQNPIARVLIPRSGMPTPPPMGQMMVNGAKPRQ